MFQSPVGLDAIFGADVYMKFVFDPVLVSRQK